MGESYSEEVSAMCRQAFEGCPDVRWTADPLYIFCLLLHIRQADLKNAMVAAKLQYEHW